MSEYLDSIGGTVDEYTEAAAYYDALEENNNIGHSFVDADKMEAFLRVELGRTGKRQISLEEFCFYMNLLISKDVAPVGHAHWMYRFDTGIYQTEFLCSRCSRPARTLTACKLEDVDYEYCPHCMAKMDEEA